MLGWRWGMWVPALCALAIASVIIFTITDKPEDKGWGPVDGATAVKADEKSEADGNETEEEKKAAAGQAVKDILLRDVLPNPWVRQARLLVLALATRAL